MKAIGRSVVCLFTDERKFKRDRRERGGREEKVSI
jgi:hypothetical protein